MSADMEQLVVDLLEDLRDEPAALTHAAAEQHAGTHALLLRACLELKFVERYARQAIAIVLAREGGGLAGGISLIQRPGLLSDCLDWLCVHVDVDELPLKFRPKLRRVARPAPKLPGGALVNGGSGPPRTGQWSSGLVSQVSNGASGSLDAAEDEDDEDEDEPPASPWACPSCTRPMGRPGLMSAAPPPPPAAAVAAAAAAAGTGPRRR